MPRLDGPNSGARQRISHIQPPGPFPYPKQLRRALKIVRKRGAKPAQPWRKCGLNRAKK
jgi:hypothetical protein